MAVVRCVMMQRDEETLLESWFRYYGYLFGFENLTVFDNGSRLPSVIATLKRYEAAGAKICWGYDRLEDFEGKGYHFTNVIGSWDHDHEYDFAIPLDCDEFLALFTDDGVTCERAALHGYLDGLRGGRQAIGIEWSLYNVPGRTGWFRPELYMKGFLPRGTIGFLDHGFHVPESRYEPGRRETRLAYMHLHNKGYEMTRDHARRKLAHLVDVDDEAALRAYAGPGSHLLNHFLVTEAEFEAKYDNVVTIWSGGFIRLLIALGASWPELGAECGAHPLERTDNVVIRLPGRGRRRGRKQDVALDAGTYKSLNPDVERSTSTALMHYLRFGHGEGRRLAPSRAASA